MMDADVPTLVPLIYVGVNEEHDEGELDNEAVSVISVSLLAKLKERESLRVEQIGMVRQEVGDDEEDDDEEEMAVDAPVPSSDPMVTTNVNPSLADAETDEVQAELRRTQAMQANLRDMSGWRGQRSSSSALVLLPPSTAPTQNLPQNGADMARNALVDTLTGQVLVATPIDGSDSYVVPAHHINTDMSVTYKMISTREAVRDGLVDGPTLASDHGLPLARTPGSNRAGKRRVGDTDGDDALPQLPAPKTYEQQLAEALNIASPAAVPAQQKRQVVYTEEMKLRPVDTKEENARKKVMRKEARDEVASFNTVVDYNDTLKTMSEQKMQMSFHADWEDYTRRKGVRPPLEAVIYWVIYFPFLKDVLAGPPYNYLFAESDIQRVVQEAKFVKIIKTDRMDAEDSIKSILASAMLKMNKLEEDGIYDETDRAVLETLKSIIERYTKGQQELLSSMQASSRQYQRGLLQSKDFEQTKEGLDDAPQVDILDRLNETLGMGSAGTSQAGTKKYIVRVFDNGTGSKNPHIEKLNSLYEQYVSNTVTAAEKKSIEDEYKAQFELHNSYVKDLEGAQSALRLAIAESSALYKDSRSKALELQELLNEKEDERDELEAEAEEQAEEEKKAKWELAKIVYDWSRTPNDVKQQIFPPDGQIPEGDTSAQRQERQTVLEERLQANRERERRVAELGTEIQALFKQITQYVFAAENSEVVKKTANAKLRYQREARVELTAEQKERRREQELERRQQKQKLEKETGGDSVQMAQAVVDQRADDGRVRIDRDVTEAKTVIERLKSAKEAFVREKDAKLKDRNDRNSADERRRSELFTQIATAKKKLQKGAKAALVEKVWDAAAGNAPLNQKYKNRQDAVTRLKVDADRLNQEFHDCVKETVEKGKRRKKLRPLKDLADEYKVVLAQSEGQVSPASVEIAAKVKEQYPAFVTGEGGALRMKPRGVEKILELYSSVSDELQALGQKCIEMKTALNAKNKEIADRNLEFNQFTGRLLDDLFRQSLSSDGAPPGPPTDKEKANAAGVVELIVEAQEIKLNIDERNKAYKASFESDYSVEKSVEKLKGSSSAVAKAYAQLYAELRAIRERIEYALKAVAINEVLDYDYAQDILSVFNEGKRKSLSAYVDVKSTAANAAGNIRHAGELKANLALKITQSKRLKPRMVAPIVDKGKKEIDEDLKDAVTGQGITERSEKKMRLAEYQDAVDDIVRFAKAGSGRALHYYSMLCWYALYLSALSPEGGDESSLLASFDGSIQDCGLPPNGARSLAIYWENVERYKPTVGAPDRGAELIYVIVQWTRLPMERRAGSMPSRGQLQAWIDARVIEAGADGSPPQIDEITGELMVVTNEDSAYNRARAVGYVASSERYTVPNSAGNDQRSEPLGPIKRTPVSWVAISRGRSIGVHVPITDEFSICRMRPSPPFGRTWPLHLTELEAVQDYMIADNGREQGKEARARAAFKAAQKWRRSSSDNGHRYPEFDPSDFSPAFWTAVETSRDNHARLVDDYNSFVDHISQLQQKMDDLSETAETADGSSMSTKTVASLAEEAGVGVDESVLNANVLDRGLLNLSTMKGTVSAILTVYRKLKTLELARDRLGYRMAADFGIPKTGYTNLSGNTMQVFQDMLDFRTQYQSSVEESSVLDRAPRAAQPYTATDGINATTGNRMWLDNRQTAERAVMLFNQFLQLYYPWETPLSVDDEARILRFLIWMRKLRDYNFTHVVLLMKSETDMRMWVRGVNGGGASQRVLGPGLTSSTQGFREDSAEDRQRQSRWYTYAADWSDNTASRVEKFETSVVVADDHNEEETGENRFMTRLTALVKEAAAKKERDEIMQRVDRVGDETSRLDMRSSGSDAYQKQSTSRKQMALLELLNVRGARLPNADDEESKHLFDAVTGQLDETQRKDFNSMIENGTLGANPYITVTIEGDGAVAARNLNVKLLEVEPRYMKAVIKALRRDFPGKYSTCLRFVTVNGDLKKVGNIVVDKFAPTDGVVPDTFFNLKSNRQAIGSSEFVDWLDSELSNAQQLQALASSSGASSSNAPLLPPPDSSTTSDVDMLPLPAPPSGDADGGASDAEAAAEAERRRLENDRMWDEAIRDAERTDPQQQGRFVLSDDDDSDDDSDGEPADAALPSEGMDTTEALADEQKAIEEADLYIMAMRNTRVAELDSNTLECILRMYDPGLLRSPMAACGGPIRPMPLPDFELEVA